uniref:Uncharacterized protein n=1 Tax=Anguilla anguilla TaxID=7936 RepID=A0A0E9R473_ANGAN
MPQRWHVFGLSVRPSVCHIFVNMISQECLEGISSSLVHLDSRMICIRILVLQRSRSL